MGFTLNGAKANEQEVLQLLNNLPGSDFKLHPNEYSHYDIFGQSDDQDTVVEVKERRQVFPTWYIEKKKVFDIADQLKREGKDPKEVNIYLCVSVEGKHLLYDLKDLSSTWKTTFRYMNARTAKGMANQGQKIKKEVYEFNYNQFKIELKSGDLGHLYEAGCINTPF